MYFSKDLFFTSHWTESKEKHLHFVTIIKHSVKAIEMVLRNSVSLSLPACTSVNTFTCMLYNSTITLHIGFIVHKSICIEPHNGRTVTWMSYCICPGSIALFWPLVPQQHEQIETHVLRCSFIGLQQSLTVTEWGLSHSVITLSVIIWFCYCKSQQCFSACTIQMC